VKEGLQIQHETLIMELSPWCTGVPSEGSGRALVLTCGNFFFPSRPDDFDVVWHRPGARYTEGSSAYVDGQFQLWVDVGADVEGEYQCVIPGPPHPTDKVCGTRDYYAFVNVRARDLMDADCRLDLMDAKFQAGIETNRKSIDILREENNKKVAFSASHISNYNRIRDSVIYKWNEVNVNTNRAFDKTSGVFTAPFGGLYFFELTIVAKMEGIRDGSRFGARLMVDGRSKAESRADFGKKDQWAQVTTQMVVSLRANQKVDARPLFSGTRIHNSEKKNSFVGFLIKPDQ